MSKVKTSGSFGGLQYNFLRLKEFNILIVIVELHVYTFQKGIHDYVLKDVSHHWNALRGTYSTHLLSQQLFKLANLPKFGKKIDSRGNRKHSLFLLSPTFPCMLLQ